MLAKILIPVTGGTADNSKTADQGNHPESRPSFLLVPAIPLSEATIRTSK